MLSNAGMDLFNPLLVEKYEEILRASPGSKVFSSLAQIYRARKQLKKAEKVCLQGISHNPSYSAGYVLLAKIHCDKGDSQQALSILNQARELGPDNYQVYQLLGEIYREMRDPARTLSAFKMVLFLRPWDQTAKKTVEHLEAMLPPEDLEAAPQQWDGGEKTPAAAQSLSEGRAQAKSSAPPLAAFSSETGHAMLPPAASKREAVLKSHPSKAGASSGQARLSAEDREQPLGHPDEQPLGHPDEQPPLSRPDEHTPLSPPSKTEASSGQAHLSAEDRERPLGRPDEQPLGHPDEQPPLSRPAEQPPSGRPSKTGASSGQARLSAEDRERPLGRPDEQPPLGRPDKHTPLGRPSKTEASSGQARLSAEDRERPLGRPDEQPPLGRSDEHTPPGRPDEHTPLPPPGLKSRNQLAKIKKLQRILSRIERAGAPAAQN